MNMTVVEDISIITLQVNLCKGTICKNNICG